jgi:LPPG:FO 2-phospho-L-lactate transferase
MRVAALAGGVGAGKFLRGLARAVAPSGITVIGNTGDDLVLHGLHISPDLDSVTYWLSGLADRDRGWGREGETFRAMDALDRLGGESWFRLGDLDMATHLYRTHRLSEGATLSEVTAELGKRLGVPCRLVPMSDDPVRTWVTVEGPDGEEPLPFQEYWVRRRARDPVREVTFRRSERARPAPGVLETLGEADAILLCPSNPVVSILPILSVPGIREAIAARRERVVGVSPIVGGRPLQGMADKLLPALKVPVTAVGAGSVYRGLLGAWVIDERDAELRETAEAELGTTIAVTDTIMSDDEAAERLARFALELVS